MTLYALAQRFVGEIKERPGVEHHPFVTWSHELAGMGRSVADEVPWCSSILNAWCWILRLQRSRSASARSWLMVGRPVALLDAVVGFDVVVLKRGVGPQPGPEVIDANGHVGIFAGLVDNRVALLGGNQSNSVTIQTFKVEDVLSVRRLGPAS